MTAKNHMKAWSAEDEEFLMDNWDSMSRRALSDLLERTPDALVTRHWEILNRGRHAGKGSHNFGGAMDSAPDTGYESIIAVALRYGYETTISASGNIIIRKPSA